MDTAPHSGQALVPVIRSWWWLPVAAVVYFGALAAGLIAKSYGLMAPELGVDVALSRGRNGALIGLSQAVNYSIGPAGAVLILLITCTFLLMIRRDPLKALAFGSVAGIGWISSEVAKLVVGRLRPPVDAVHSLAPETGSNSFPSGHTAFAVALVWAVVFVIGRTTAQKTMLLASGAGFVAIVAFSRLYLGVHYPTDVIGSVFISSAAILAWLPIWNNLIAPRLATAGALQRFTRKKRPHPSSPKP